LFIVSSSFLSENCPRFRRRSGQRYASVSDVLLIKPDNDSNNNARCSISQALSHTFWRLPFADKCICASRKCGLLAGIQMADEDDDQRGWANPPTACLHG
jgi:hypothetical protein